MILTITFLLPIITGVVCCIANIAYAFTDQRRKAKNPIRIIAGMAALYFVAIYTWGMADNTVYIIRSGILTRLGVALLLVLLISEVIADWRKK